MSKDIRWKQRFVNFKKAFAQLEKAVVIEELSDLEREGLIQRFEYTFELAWKTLQDLFKEKGYIGITGPNPVIEQAFTDGYISDSKAWARMAKSRNLTSHTYNEETAEDIAEDIVDEYFDLFSALIERLDIESTGHKQTKLFGEE